jgi:hypothetical protein
MGYWIDEDSFQFDSEAEMAKSLGIDLETMEGDYAEAFHRESKRWANVKIDQEFTDSNNM